MKHIYLTMAVALASCAVQETAKVEIIPNPMVSLWDKVGGKLESLESKKAMRDEWRMSAESETIITDKAQLKILMEQSRLDPMKQSQALAAYKPNRLAAHYGFEGDYHALVIFETNEKPASVFKW